MWKISVQQNCVQQNCVRQSCVWKSCVWQSCVWKNCVWQSCGWKSCVRQSCVWESVCDKVVCVTKIACQRLCVWQSCAWKIVCDQVVCDECVWQSIYRCWFILSLSPVIVYIYIYVQCTFILSFNGWCCARPMHSTAEFVTTVLSKCVCVWKIVRDKVVCERVYVTKLCVAKGAQRRRRRRRGRDTEPKTRTPHKDVGNNLLEFNTLQCVLLFVV